MSPKKEGKILFSIRLPARVIDKIIELAEKKNVFQCDVVEEAIKKMEGEKP